mmetsp:Transcript_21685/g.52961  ORF Transcript_21685/g.52961 Transcript_21685/m.52961 type:complete len:407 (+) Transcript_21685:108-1328(+)
MSDGEDAVEAIAHVEPHAGDDGVAGEDDGGDAAANERAVRTREMKDTLKVASDAACCAYWHSTCRFEYDDRILWFAFVFRLLLGGGVLLALLQLQSWYPSEVAAARAPSSSSRDGAADESDEGNYLEHVLFGYVSFATVVDNLLFGTIGKAERPRQVIMVVYLVCSAVENAVLLANMFLWEYVGRWPWMGLCAFLPCIALLVIQMRSCRFRCTCGCGDGDAEGPGPLLLTVGIFANWFNSLLVGGVFAINAFICTKFDNPTFVGAAFSVGVAWLGFDALSLDLTHQLHEQWLVDIILTHTRRNAVGRRHRRERIERRVRADARTIIKCNTAVEVVALLKYPLLGAYAFGSINIAAAYGCGSLAEYATDGTFAALMTVSHLFVLAGIVAKIRYLRRLAGDMLHQARA